VLGIPTASRSISRTALNRLPPKFLTAANPRSVDSSPGVISLHRLGTCAVTGPRLTLSRFPVPSSNTQVSIVLGTHDNCGAMSVGQDMSADRPEQHSGEAAVTSVTQN
jgi:hypothetical protein